MYPTQAVEHSLLPEMAGKRVGRMYRQRVNIQAVPIPGDTGESIVQSST